MVVRMLKERSVRLDIVDSMRLLSTSDIKLFQLHIDKDLHLVSLRRVLLSPNLRHIVFDLASEDFRFENLMLTLYQAFAMAYTAFWINRINFQLCRLLCNNFIDVLMECLDLIGRLRRMMTAVSARLL